MEWIALVAYDGGMDRIHVDLVKPWLTVADICDYMDVSTFVVTSVLRSGDLPAVKFGREWRVARDDFEDWINAQRTESTSSEVDESLR
jgi:excisionase family DNA binding protein